MDQVYVYTKKRKDFGRQCLFSDFGAEIHVDCAPDAALAKKFIRKTPLNQSVQVASEYSEHEVNTIRYESDTKGVNHTEGGWPKDVNPNEPEQTHRHRKKIEKEEQYQTRVTQLCNDVEHVIKQNNAINIYEEFFTDTDIELFSEDAPSMKTVNVFRDPMSTKRTANHLSWHPEGGRHLAVSYCNLEFDKFPEQTQADAYIWDIENPNKPDFVVKSLSPLVTIEYQPKDANILLGGCLNGQVGFWDIRKGSQPVEMSPIENSHIDPAYNALWIQSKSNAEFFSSSTDGQVLWWDLRKLGTPTDTLILDQHKRGDINSAYGSVSLEYEMTIPTKFMVGTSTGQIISCNRKGKTDAEKIATVYPGHYGPVYSIERNPYFSKNFLSVGDWTCRIWTEDLKESCIMWTNTHMHYLTDGKWSKTRPAVFFTTKKDGTLDVWDFIMKQREPIISTHIVDEALFSVKCQDSGRFLVCGSESGTVTLVELSESLYQLQRNEKSLMTAAFERETRREKILEARQREMKLKEKIGSQRGEEPKNEGAAETQEGLTVEEAEKDFWRIIDEERNRRQKKTTLDKGASEMLGPSESYNSRRKSSAGVN
ncbi:hypothetical protein SNEBB_010015 [Seison nebaliae]|nr:hypothetical protein SNEBB_010015 [Seison nebaliae]